MEDVSPNPRSQPLRVAIVGSGPAGFYSAAQLQKSKGADFSIDMFDRLPTPWGLVRAGVAPDHPNIKAVTRVYEKIARHPDFRFYGNVEIGRDLSRADLLGRYHAVVYAFGAQADKRLDIPGEHLPGSWAATEFVAWYNGHPDYHDREFDLSCERVAVIGNGNVAADVARMLALTVEELATTDVADHALHALRDSAVREIIVLGRRGPAQAAFTNPEVLELGELADADVIVDPADVELDPLSAEWLASDAADVTDRRNVEIFTEYSQRPAAGKRRRIVLRFLASPVEIGGDGQVEWIIIRRNELVAGDAGAIRARPSDRTETIPVGLVFRSVGYRGIPLPDVPFDEPRGVIPNDRGRVLDPVGGVPLTGEYAVGWIKRGPSGIIGTNKKDANETMERLLEDAATSSGVAMSQAHPPQVEAVTRYLAEQGIAYEVVEHPHTESALAEADAVGVPSDHAAKTVVLTEGERFWFAVVPASHHVDLHKAREALRTEAHLRLATEAEIEAHVRSFEVGATPPLGPLLRAFEIIDRRLLDHDTILFSAGDHSHAIVIDPFDLVEVVQPHVADICRDRIPRGHLMDGGLDT